MKDARKLLRLFKWLFEYKKIKKLLEKPPKGDDEIDLILGKNDS